MNFFQLYVIYWIFILGGSSNILGKSVVLKKLVGNEDLDKVLWNREGGRVRRSIATLQEQEDILAKHNDLRRLEGASNMQLLTWNDELATLADEWSQGCLWEHGQPPHDPADLPYNPIGQNLYYTNAQSPSLDLDLGIQRWYDEKSNYDLSTGFCATDQVCGHYKQVVWATTEEVGCAYNLCAELVKPDVDPPNDIVYDAWLLVCNYGPPGNKRGDPPPLPYEVGDSCSTCLSPTDFCDDGLCSGLDPAGYTGPSTLGATTLDITPATVVTTETPATVVTPEDLTTPASPVTMVTTEAPTTPPSPATVATAEPATTSAAVVTTAVPVVTTVVTPAVPSVPVVTTVVTPAVPSVSTDVTSQTRTLQPITTASLSTVAPSTVIVPTTPPDLTTMPPTEVTTADPVSTFGPTRYPTTRRVTTTQSPGVSSYLVWIICWFIVGFLLAIISLVGAIICAKYGLCRRPAPPRPTAPTYEVKPRPFWEHRHSEEPYWGRRPHY